MKYIEFLEKLFLTILMNPKLKCFIFSHIHSITIVLIEGAFYEWYFQMGEQCLNTWRPFYNTNLHNKSKKLYDPNFILLLLSLLTLIMFMYAFYKWHFQVGEYCLYSQLTSTWQYINKGQKHNTRVWARN